MVHGKTSCILGCVLALTTTFMMTACAYRATLYTSDTNHISMLSEETVRLWRQGKIKLIDTRSAAERSGRPIERAIPIQYGPDIWVSTVTEPSSKHFSWNWRLRG